MLYEYYDQLLEAIYNDLLEESPWHSFPQQFRRLLKGNDIGLIVELPELETSPIRLRDNETDYRFLVQYNQ